MLYIIYMHKWKDVHIRCTMLVVIVFVDIMVNIIQSMYIRMYYYFVIFTIVLRLIVIRTEIIKTKGKSKL